MAVSSGQLLPTDLEVGEESWMAAIKIWRSEA